MIVCSMGLDVWYLFNLILYYRVPSVFLGEDALEIDIYKREVKDVGLVCIF